jgi:putative intracellular protease/amidase
VEATSPNIIMPSALILIADGSEEIEFVTPYDGA